MDHLPERFGYEGKAVSSEVETVPIEKNSQYYDGTTKLHLLQPKIPNGDMQLPSSPMMGSYNNLRGRAVGYSDQNELGRLMPK